MIDSRDDFTQERMRNLNDQCELCSCVYSLVQLDGCVCVGLHAEHACQRGAWAGRLAHAAWPALNEFNTSDTFFLVFVLVVFLRGADKLYR